MSNHRGSWIKGWAWWAPLLVCALAAACGGDRAVGNLDLSGVDTGPGLKECVRISQAADCARSGCVWKPPGCGAAPPGHINGLCFAAPLKECQLGICPAGSVCTGVWYNPCAGSACTACGAQTRYCLPAP